jgi:hypothetical protein
MGAAQACEGLDSLRIAIVHWRPVRPRLPRLQSQALLTRQFGIAEAAFVLMASSFLSALLGAVRQVLFNAQFGASAEANAYYAAFRLPDTLFSLIAAVLQVLILLPGAWQSDFRYKPLWAPHDPGLKQDRLFAHPQWPGRGRGLRRVHPRYRLRFAGPRAGQPGRYPQRLAARGLACGPPRTGRRPIRVQARVRSEVSLPALVADQM